MATEVTIFGVPVDQYNDEFVPACPGVNLAKVFDTANPITIDGVQIYPLITAYDSDSIFAALDDPEDPFDDDAALEAAFFIAFGCGQYTYIKSNQGTGPNS